MGTCFYFKHYCNMSESVLILKLEKRFGIKGYAWWNKLMELLYENWDDKNEPKFEFHKSTLRRKFHGSDTNVRVFLQFCVTNSALLCDFREDSIFLEYPKMAEVKRTRSEITNSGRYTKNKNKKEKENKKEFLSSPKTSNPSGCDSASQNQNSTLHAADDDAVSNELIPLIHKFYCGRKLSDSFVEKELPFLINFVGNSESNLKDLKYAVYKISKMLTDNMTRKKYGFFTTKLEKLLDNGTIDPKYLDNDYEPFLLNKEDFDPSVIDCNTGDPEEDAKTLQALKDMGYEVYDV